MPSISAVQSNHSGVTSPFVLSPRIDSDFEFSDTSDGMLSPSLRSGMFSPSLVDEDPFEVGSVHESESSWGSLGRRTPELWPCPTSSWLYGFFMTSDPYSGFSKHCTIYYTHHTDTFLISSSSRLSISFILYNVDIWDSSFANCKIIGNSLLSCHCCIDCVLHLVKAS